MTNRRLLLMRHAKSDWSNESLSDHDRPLNHRGREATPRMADWVHQVGELPNLILCSSSARTQQTARILLDSWGATVPMKVLEELYLAPPGAIVDVVEENGGDAETLMVIAHNPGMTSLVSGLAQRMIEMPTAAVAVFGVPSGISVDPSAVPAEASVWNRFGACEGVELVDFAKPKALP